MGVPWRGNSRPIVTLGASRQAPSRFRRSCVAARLGAAPHSNHPFEAWLDVIWYLANSARLQGELVRTSISAVDVRYRTYVPWPLSTILQREVEFHLHCDT